MLDISDVALGLAADQEPGNWNRVIKRLRLEYKNTKTPQKITNYTYPPTIPTYMPNNSSPPLQQGGINQNPINIIINTSSDSLKNEDDKKDIIKESAEDVINAIDNSSQNENEYIDITKEIFENTINVDDTNNFGALGIKPSTLEEIDIDSQLDGSDKKKVIINQ